VIEGCKTLGEIERVKIARPNRVKAVKKPREHMPKSCQWCGGVYSYPRVHECKLTAQHKLALVKWAHMYGSRWKTELRRTMSFPPAQSLVAEAKGIIGYGGLHRVKVNTYL
jgi:hypothetical protein